MNSNHNLKNSLPVIIFYIDLKTELKIFKDKNSFLRCQVYIIEKTSRKINTHFPRALKDIFTFSKLKKKGSLVREL